MMKRGLAIFLFTLTGFVNHVYANEVEIVKVTMESSAGTWTFNVTLLHKDSGWEHYADGWRVVDAKGKELGYRKLWHPHKNEQPFTRGLSGVSIPKGTTTIYVEAHDKVHGWSKQRVKIDLTKPKGDRYLIRSR